jgi:hypothetical protein
MINSRILVNEVVFDVILYESSSTEIERSHYSCIDVLRKCLRLAEVILTCGLLLPNPENSSISLSWSSTQSLSVMMSKNQIKMSRYY